MMEVDLRQVPIQVLKFSRDSHLNAQTLRGIANDHIGRALQIEARAQDIGGICDHLRKLADDINARAAAIAASAEPLDAEIGRRGQNA